MKICKSCKNTFSILTKVDGKIKNLGSRSRCLNCSPFGAHDTRKCGSEGRSRPARIDSLPKEEFELLIKNSRSRSEVFDKLNMCKSGAAFSILNRRIDKEKIDTSHFMLGGEISNNRKISDKDFFSEFSNISSSKLKIRIIKDKIFPYACSVCGLFNWRDSALSLQLDHINGIRTDNRLENLRFLCPNCHTQTDTYAGKNIKKKSHSRVVSE